MLARLRAIMRSESGGGGENVTGGWLERFGKNGDFFELRIGCPRASTLAFTSFIFVAIFSEET